MLKPLVGVFEHGKQAGQFPFVEMTRLVFGGDLQTGREDVSGPAIHPSIECHARRPSEPIPVKDIQDGIHPASDNRHRRSGPIPWIVEVVYG